MVPVKCIGVNYIRSEMSIELSQINEINVFQLSNDKELDLLLSLTVSQLQITGCLETKNGIKKYF